jgi:hypothetical protein
MKLNWRIDIFGDLIELEISLINEIKGLIEEIPKFDADSRQNCKKLESNDQGEMATVL